MSALSRTHRGALGASGPLLYVARTHEVALGELVEIRAPGQRTRRGQVIDAGVEVTVIQVLDETLGLAPQNAEIVFDGETATATVGRELLGRMFTGSGAPADGLPAPIGDARRAIWGAAINPMRRKKPADTIETGVSAIDGMNTLVRGQKLPVFSGPGMPALELASMIVESARAPRGEPFAVIFAAIGVTERETELFLRRFQESGAREKSVIYLNRASDPTIERLLTPRFALTEAEYLAYDCGLHVLVVLADVTHYCEALREVSTAREEIPGRRGYPGYMYTDLASLFERAGALTTGGGSITQLPILTMPDDDITHPIPDLTGYITEGQIVLDRSLHRAGVFPPIDVLPSLSRLMNAGIRREQREWANQLYAIYAQCREARMMASIVGEGSLSAADRRALAFGARFENEFVNQGKKRRTLEETIELGWTLLETLPREEWLKISEETWTARKEQRR